MRVLQTPTVRLIGFAPDIADLAVHRASTVMVCYPALKNLPSVVGYAASCESGISPR